MKIPSVYDATMSMSVIRESRGMSVKELSRKTGICYATLRGYEEHRGYPGLYNLMLIADALGSSPDELVGWGK